MYFQNKTIEQNAKFQIKEKKIILLKILFTEICFQTTTEKLSKKLCDVVKVMIPKSILSHQN